ncbi:ribosome maturation factor RimM [Candidatus Arthromitus sp. SFB-turkey]|uniref:ribosome maturation factor RimM n=1 Tax=Candidatus Arthromitus sp. SFB-turkey TaxID=1840217 RepID=UPI0007F3CE7E|nr:ribosome maturation factor RimM [Candidatus Arthromitus sp. SFB-turkey]OAT86587.1 16S rRNA processing protein RimM [Candidatus Arthromitus sp. SFB-turkey]HJD00183.1 ribosome maturation factor RimM [Candidatus Dwaynia gallinarum]
MIKHFAIGKISKPHGVRGEINIIPFDEDLSIFNELNKVFLSSSDTDESDLKEIEIDSIKFKNKKVVVKLSGCDTCNDAELLRNKFIRIAREDISLKDGDYFIADIKECNVYDDEGEFLGKISEVIQTKNNDVYWIKKTSFNDELLIPVLKSIIVDINIEQKKVIIKPVKSWSL